jgi:hypothetical protein
VIGLALSRDLHLGICLVQNRILYFPTQKLMRNSTNLPTPSSYVWKVRTSYHRWRHVMFMVSSCWRHVMFIASSCWRHVMFIVSSCWRHVMFIVSSCWRRITFLVSSYLSYQHLGELIFVHPSYLAAYNLRNLTEEICPNSGWGVFTRTLSAHPMILVSRSCCHLYSFQINLPRDTLKKQDVQRTYTVITRCVRVTIAAVERE